MITSDYMNRESVHESFIRACEDLTIEGWFKDTLKALASQVSREAFFDALWRDEPITDFHVELEDVRLKPLVIESLKKRGCTILSVEDNVDSYFIIATHPLLTYDPSS